MPDDPAPIPCRTALRACAHALFGEAQVLRGRTPDSSAFRGAQAQRNAAAKHARRLGQAAAMERAASDLLGASRSPEAAHWPGVDAAVLGYPIAWLCGHGEALHELRAELEDQGRPGALGVP